MNTDNAIRNLERQIVVKKIARQYNVTETYVRCIRRGERKPSSRQGALVMKALHEYGIL